MSDNPIRELGNAQAVEDGTSQGEAATTGESANRQPEKIDLSKLPEFQSYQSGVDRRMGEMQQRVQFEAHQRAQLEEQLHSIRMQGMDEQQQLAYQNQLLQRQMQELQRQRDLDILAIQRQRDLEEIVSTTGIPWDKLEGVPNIHEAWRRGQQHQKTVQMVGGQQPSPERQVDDRVDVAGSKPRSTTERIQQKYNDAKKAYNLDGILEAMAEASDKGFTINEW